MAVVLKQPIEGIGMLIGMVFMAKTSIDRHIDVMDIEPNVVSPEEPTTSEERGLVELENVHFRYPDASEDLIKGATLRIEPGETMALVSATGGGTSTLLNLVPRLYDVAGGRVLVDGVDVREYSLPDLRSRIAVAFEDPTLFSTTVKSNVLLGTGHHRTDDNPGEGDPPTRTGTKLRGSTSSTRCSLRRCTLRMPSSSMTFPQAWTPGSAKRE